MNAHRMKYYLSIIFCFFLSCKTSQKLPFETLAVYKEDSPLSCFLIFNYGFNTYAYLSPLNFSIIGDWHIVDDTLLLTPQYEATISLNNNIDMTSLKTDEKRNEILNAKPMKCLIRGEDLFILPNDEPFLVKKEDGFYQILPPETGASGFIEPRKFILWSKHKNGNPFSNFMIRK